MAYQTIDIVLIVEIECFCIGQVITCMALRAHAFITLGVGTEVVDDFTFTKLLTGNRIGVFPGPVFVMYELFTCFVVAFQTGFGDCRAIFKRAFATL